jgi:hypothetical protein
LRIMHMRRILVKDCFDDDLIILKAELHDIVVSPPL